ncbi:TVP38/TMEM64 family protein [Candidatus Nanosalina sp. VS9-1]|uniref:TVP38/TMEM64 family protein n=1 Tax=Candidatus Nanosalina sp. VS9-1 TaxID=3388566 RepID=UPI0039DFA83B
MDHDRIKESINIRNLLILATLAAGLYGITVFTVGQLDILFDPEKLAQILGPLGPPGIIAGQIAQVLLAPIPPVTAVVSGLLYGPWLGAFYSIIGASTGSVIAVFLSRKYGRPVVEKFVSDQAMEKFDEYTQKTGYLPFIILFVLPGFPDDALCFIAGLTNLDWKILAFIGSVGRLPGILMLTTTGHSVAEANLVLFAVVSSAVVSISLFSVRYRREIESWIDGRIGWTG